MSKSTPSKNKAGENSETAFYYGNYLLGGQSVTSPYTSYQNAYVDFNAAHPIFHGIYGGLIFIHIHPPPNDPGLSGNDGDIGTSKSSGILVVAVDYDGTAYCYAPR